MEKQVIISINREFESGGLLIAQKLAKDLNLLSLDHTMLDQIAKDGGVDMSSFKEYDEKPKNKLLTRSVRGMSNSYEDHVAELQFDYMKSKADSGESMIVVGRCSDYVLKDYPGLITIFITADTEDKVKRTMEENGISEEKAKVMAYKGNQRRKLYHNQYADTKWGDSRYYDLCINSSRLGLDGTAEFIKEYVLKRNA